MKIDEEILNRKGARKPTEVPSEILDLLNQGKIETVNLSEWLAVDQHKLFNDLAETLKISHLIIKEVNQALEEEKKPTSNTFSKLIGQTIENTSENSEEILQL
ncbi:MAG: DNA alkylation repair protein, partial [Bacteroidota bacterium]